MTCAAWDGGAIRAAMKEVLGFALEQKTTKTRCGRRRKLSQIDNDTPTCADCREAIRRDRETAYELGRELERIKDGRTPS